MMTGASIKAWQDSGRPVLLDGEPVTFLRMRAVLGCCGWHTVAVVRLGLATCTVSMDALRLGARS